MGSTATASPQGNTPGPRSHQLSPAWLLVTSPWDTQQSSRDRCRWFCSKDSRGSFLLSLLAPPQSYSLGQRDVVAPCSWLEFPPKNGFLLGEGPPQSQDYSSECYIRLPQMGRSLAASSFCLQPGLSPLPHPGGMQTHKHSMPNLQPLSPLTLAVPRSHLTCSHRLFHAIPAHSIT